MIAKVSGALLLVYHLNLNVSALLHSVVRALSLCLFRIVLLNLVTGALGIAGVSGALHVVYRLHLNASVVACITSKLTVMLHQSWLSAQKKALSANTS